MGYDDILALPSVQNWTKAKVFKVGYEDAGSFLYFLNKYVTVMVGGTRALAKYYKVDCGKYCWIGCQRQTLPTVYQSMRVHMIHGGKRSSRANNV